jgi:hypothetical protein
MVAMEAKCIGAAAAKSSCELGFAEWMGVGVPVGIVMLLASYVAIIVAYRPSVARVPVFDSGARVFFSWQHNVTCATLAATAALWCTFTFVSPYFGSLGAIGLIPVIVLHPHPHHTMQCCTLTPTMQCCARRHSRCAHRCCTAAAFSTCLTSGRWTGTCCCCWAAAARWAVQ